MRGNACLIKPSKFAERRLLIAWKCAKLRLPIAWKCAELRPANAWKCAEPRFAWECELSGRLRTAARVCGTRVGSAREVRLKRVEPRFHALVGPVFIPDRHIKGLKDTSNLLDRWIMKQNLHSIADTIVDISIDSFVVWTGLQAELYMQ